MRCRDTSHSIVYMKKILSQLLLVSCLFYSKPLLSDGPQEEQPAEEKKEQGKAAKEGKSHATAIAWAGVGVTLLVVTGVVVAIAINRDNDKTSTSHN